MSACTVAASLDSQRMDGPLASEELEEESRERFLDTRRLDFQNHIDYDMPGGEQILFNQRSNLRLQKKQAMNSQKVNPGCAPSSSAAVPFELRNNQKVGAQPF